MTGEAPEARSLLRWLWQDYLRRHRVVVILALLLMAIEGGMVGLLSYMVQPMFDQIFVAGDRGAVGWVAAAVAGIFILRAVAGFGHRVIMDVVGQRVSAALQRDLLGHMLRLDSAFFRTNSPGTLIERVRGDTLVASQIWAVVFGAIGRDTVSLLSLLAVAISVDWLWTLIAVAGAPLLLGPIVLLQRWVRQTARRAREAAAHLSTRLDETFHGIDTIKLNRIEKRDAGRFGAAIHRYVGAEIRSKTGQAGIPALMDLVAAVGFFGVLSYGGLQIIDGQKTVGEFMSFFTAMALVFEPLRRLGNVSGAWAAALASLERVHSVFDQRPTILSPPAPAPRPEAPGAEDIVLSDVVFSYDGDPVLRGVSFTAAAGETTALVGPSGAGKSTIFAILTRLIDRDGGSVRIGETPIEALDLADLRGLFSIVTQDAPMFDETLRDNILLGREDVDDTMLADVLKAAYLTDFVAGLPNGLDTLAGPRGSSLSGGQRQRVAIARALLQDAPILLLDEATSALDAASEAAVQGALDRLSEGRTTVVIAHRLSTIREAERIVVMSEGQVVDQGRHEDLIEKDGIYARLHGLQFRDGSRSE